MKDLKEIREIYETTFTGEVNSFLSRGWQIIDIYHKTTGNLQTNQMVPSYILGRPEDISFKAEDIKKEMEEEVKKTFENYYREE